MIPPSRAPVKRSSIEYIGTVTELCYLGIFVPDYDEDDILPPALFHRKRMGRSFLRAQTRNRDVPMLYFIEGFDIDDTGRNYVPL